MRRPKQEGYALLVVLLAFSLLVLAMARAVPAWKTAIQREREARMIDHAREYRTAIRRYFHKYGRYPADLDALTQKDGFGMRYLRQTWPDPLNPATDGAWQLIHYGQANSAEIVDQPPPAALASGASGISGPNLTMGSGASAPGAGGAGAAIGVPGGLGATGASAGGSTVPGMMAGGAATLSATGLAGAPGAGVAAGLGGGPSSGPGANLGGGPIIGVASLNKLPAVHAFNGFDLPNQWQFIYNYALDPSLQAGTPGAGASGLPGSKPIGGASTAGSGTMGGGGSGGGGN